MKRIQLPSNGKRALSFLIDLAIVVGLTCFFYFVVFFNAVSKVQNFSKLKNDINNERLTSQLYKANDKGEAIRITDADPSLSGDDVITNYLEKFYTVDYMAKKDAKYTKHYFCTHVLYLDSKIDSEEKATKPTGFVNVYKWTYPLDKENFDYTLIDEFKSKPDDVMSFAKVSLNNAIDLLNRTDPIKAINATIAWGIARGWLYSSLTGTVIPCLIIPLCLKNGKTIGKQVMGLVVLTDEGYYYKRYKLIFRYLALYFIEIFGGFMTIMLTFILSGCLVMFSKKKRALHDFIAFSVVVDEKNSVFYLDENEEKKYIELAKAQK